MKRIFLSLSALAMMLTASAQQTAGQVNLSQGLYKGKIGLQHVKNLSDAQLSEAAKHYSATPLPSKKEVAKMLKQAPFSQTASRKARQQANIAEQRREARYTAADTLMWESWESWDGSTFAWVPSSWRRFSNFDASTYINEGTGSCPTWMAYKTDGYYVPYATDGQHVMLCLFGEEIIAADGQTVIAPMPDQDEWLVSPTASHVQATNYLSFDMAFTPIYTYLTGTTDNPEFDYDHINYDVEVLVTTETRSASNDPAKYTCLFRLSDVVADMFSKIDPENEQTLTSLLAMRWQHFKLPMTDFDGRNVRVAFRYKGKKGGAVMLDAVRISDLLPVAMYDHPEGSFYMGFTGDARLNYQKSVLMPAYTPTVWTNYSNKDTESFAWRYNINGESGTSADRDLLLSGVAPGQISWPTLQSNAGLRADEFNGGCDVVVSGQTIHSDNGTAKVGGDASITYQDGTTLNFSLGNFDPTKLYWLGEISNSGGAYAFGTGSDAFWANMTNAKYNKVSGIANVYDAPASPYVFNSVTLPLGNYFNLGANLYCTVYEARDLGNGGMEVTDNVLGQAMASEAVPVGGGHILTFTFPNVMIIDTPIAISITGVDESSVLDFAPLSQALNHDSNKGYAFVLLKNQSTQNVWWCEVAGALASVEGTGNMEISHCMGMNAVFPYLHSNDGDLFEAHTGGETKAFDIDSYWYPTKTSPADLDGWTIECSEPWVKADYAIDETEQRASLIITAETLADGIEGRSATVTIKATGCQEVITVTQGDPDAIKSPLMDIHSCESGVFNVAGMRIDSAKAKNGLFIVKKNGKYIKEIK